MYLCKFLYNMPLNIFEFKSTLLEGFLQMHHRAKFDINYLKLNRNNIILKL